MNLFSLWGIHSVISFSLLFISVIRAVVGLASTNDHLGNHYEISFGMADIINQKH